MGGQSGFTRWELPLPPGWPVERAGYVRWAGVKRQPRVRHHIEVGSYCHGSWVLSRDHEHPTIHLSYSRWIYRTVIEVIEVIDLILDFIVPPHQIRRLRRHQGLRFHSTIGGNPRCMHGALPHGPQEGSECWHGRRGGYK